MKTQDTATSSQQPWIHARDLIDQAGLHALVSQIGPGSETPGRDNTESKHIVLFVSEGSVTVNVGPNNYMLDRDQAFLVPSGRDYSIRNHTDAAAKVFTLETPVPRRVEEPLVVL